MLQWLKNRLLRSARARPAHTVHSPAVTTPEEDALLHARTLASAKQLCAAIDRGAQLKLWNHIDKLAESAAKLSWLDAPLAERLARVKIAQGDPETALAMLDRGVSSPTSLRLLRIMCLLRAGARMQAQLELNDWARAGELPIEGQLLSALLEWHAGEFSAATSMLRDVAMHAQGEDARWTQLMLILIAAAQGQWDRATARAHTLTDTGDGAIEREIAITLDSLRLGKPIDPEQQRRERIEQMASELPTSEHLIEPLVEAQRRQLDALQAEELREALQESFDDMGEHQASAAEGIARLSDLLGEHDQACEWARRGLALNPMSARLVLMLHELDGEEAAPAKPWEQAA